MTAPARPDSPSMVEMAHTLDAVEEALDAGLYPGIDPSRPPVAALFWILELLEWKGVSQQVLEALPHGPEEFGVTDLRSVLARLNIASRVEDYSKRRALELDGLGLLIDAYGHLKIVCAGSGRTPAFLDPLTGAKRSRAPAMPAQLITFSKPMAQGYGGYSKSLILRFSGTLKSVLAAKAGMAAVTAASAVAVFLIFDLVVATGSQATLYALGAGMAAAWALDILFRTAKARLVARMTARMDWIVSTDVFRKVLQLPMEKLLGGTVAEQISRMRSFNMLTATFSDAVVELICEAPFFLILAVLFYVLAGPIALVPVAALLVLVAIGAGLSARVKRREAMSRAAKDDYTRVFNDLTRYTEQIRMAGAQDVWDVRAERVARRAAVAARRAEGSLRALKTLSSLAAPIAGGTVAIWGAYMVMAGSLSNGGLIASMILVWRLIAPVQSALLLLARWPELSQLRGRLDALMRMEDETNRRDVVFLPKIKGHLSIKGVGYRYPGSTEASLRGLSVEIPAGSLVAITGPSGSGKTSLLRMIPGLLHPVTGSILIDGVNVSQFDVAYLRKVVGYMPASPILVHGTIAQNLRLAHPLASEGDIADSLTEAGLEDAVTALPDGAQTRLTEDMQAHLPSGFRQALAFAQVLIQRPSVLLLDEPARTLDPDLEAAMVSSLKRRRGQMTILMTTHRPSHVKMADFEISLKKGLQVRAKEERRIA